MKQKLLLNLIHFENIYGDITEHISNTENLASLASFRLQQRPALIAAMQMGLRVQSLSLTTEHSSPITIDARPAACLVGKLAAKENKFKAMASANLSLIKFLKAKMTPIIVIYSDHHARNSDDNGAMYKELLSNADTIITPTLKLASLAKNFSKHHAKVITIEDPWQIPSLAEYPTYTPGCKVNVIWFGSPSNAKYLDKTLRQFTTSPINHSKINLTILSTKNTLKKFRSLAFCRDSPYPPWHYSFKEWDGLKQPQQLHLELTKAHIALIPSDPNDPAKAGASHNRVVDSARGGCIPLASPLFSYCELESIAVIGDDFPKMLHDSIQNFSSLSKAFNKKRNQCLEKFDPINNLKKWEIALCSAINLH
jgi:hypothetical protein